MSWPRKSAGYTLSGASWPYHSGAGNAGASKRPVTRRSTHQPASPPAARAAGLPAGPGATRLLQYLASPMPRQPPSVFSSRSARLGSRPGMTSHWSPFNGRRNRRNQDSARRHGAPRVRKPAPSGMNSSRFSTTSTVPNSPQPKHQRPADGLPAGDCGDKVTAAINARLHTVRVRPATPPPGRWPGPVSGACAGRDMGSMGLRVCTAAAASYQP